MPKPDSDIFPYPELREEGEYIQAVLTLEAGRLARAIATVHRGLETRLRADTAWSERARDDVYSGFQGKKGNAGVS